MASVPSGVPPPPSAFATPAAAAAAPAAAIPGAEPATAKPAIDRSPEECNDNASDLWAGASHDTAAVPVTGSTTKHTKLHVAAIFCQKMSPVWAYVTKFSPAVPSGLNQGKNVKCCRRRGDGKECPLYTHNGTKALIRPTHKDHEVEWKLVFARSCRSAHAKSQRAEALVEASGSTPHYHGPRPCP